jgi:hypothetical protein
MSIVHGNGDAATSESHEPAVLPAPGGATVSRYTGVPMPDVSAEEAGGVAVEDVAPVAEAAELPFPPLRRHRLRAGCYLLRYTPRHHATIALPPHYDGTLRVERDAANTIASGDLYLHRTRLSHPLLPPREPNPGAGIPVFPIKAYRYYVRVTKILEGAALATQFTLGFELHRFDHASRTWSLDGAFSALMRWVPAPPGYPSQSNFLRGTVRNAAGADVGVLTMGWVSKHLRRATIELDRVAESEVATANSAGTGWRELFAEVGWDMTVDESDADVAEPSGDSFSDAECHATLLARRDSADLDREWRYWLVAVRNLDSTPRGIMFDAFGSDSNNIPREGAAMASHWVIPNADPWGLVKGMRFGTATDPYFRTGVHEIGHAMGLYHNTVDNGFMNTTDVIAAGAVPPQQFPQNIQWSHAPDDQKRLRHMPDLWVRPGGVPFGAAYSTAPISPDDAALEPDGLEVGVQPLDAAVPIGAPVRVDIALRNGGDLPLPAPADLSLRAGHVRGEVIDPAGTVRAFRSIVRCIEEERLEALAAGAEVRGSVTLLRGPDGALFPLAGPYTIRVQIRWELEGLAVTIAGQGSVMVTPPVDAQHAEAALRVLDEPDALLLLALGGDHLERARAAVDAALENPELRPHYAYIEAKRAATPFFDRAPDLERAAAVLDAGTVMSAAEVDRAATFLSAAKDAGAAPPAALVETLKAQAADRGAPEAQTTLEAM